MGALQYPVFFFFNDTATTEIYTLSLHDALPIWVLGNCLREGGSGFDHLALLVENHASEIFDTRRFRLFRGRSEEHTSELQSPDHLVCRLLLEKKKILNWTRRS